MWNLVRGLRERGVTIILTTHYIEEAQEMADRIGIISKGKLLLAEDKTTLMKKLGKRALTLSLQEPMSELPEALSAWPLTIKPGGYELEYTYDANDGQAGVPALLRRVAELGIGFRDLATRQSSLEDIFVNLVSASTESEART